MKFLITFTGILAYIAQKTILKDASLRSLGFLWIGALIVPATLRFVYHATLYTTYGSPYRKLPSPSEKSHWFFGHLMKLQNSQSGVTLHDWVEEHSESPFIRYFAFLQAERLMPVSHAALHTVLQTESYNFIKPKFMSRSLELIVGNGILNAEADSHRRQRKLLNPSFAFGHIKALTPIFVEKAFALTDHMSRTVGESISATEGSSDAVIRVDIPIHAATLDIIFKAGFGTEFNALENEDHYLVKAYRDVFDLSERGAQMTLLDKIDFAFSFIFRLPGALPTERNAQVKHSKKMIEKFALDLIREKQKEKSLEKASSSVTSDKKNILSILIDDGHGVWQEREILDNLMTFLAAGHETTSTATTLALLNLSKNPDVQTRLRKELQALDLDSLTYESIESVKYLNNFCREVLRFSPPVTYTTREAVKDVMVDGVLIKKGTILNIPIYAINQLRRYWGEEASVFNPDRWDNLPAEAANPYSFVTFLQGPRSCIGRKFAEVEFKALIIALVSRFEFSEVVPGEEHKTRTVITTKFVNGLPMRVRPVT